MEISTPMKALLVVLIVIAGFGWYMYFTSQQAPVQPGSQPNASETVQSNQTAANQTQAPVQETKKEEVVVNPDVHVISDKGQQSQQQDIMSKTILHFTDITLPDNDKMGAVFEVGDVAGEDMASIKDKFGLNIGESYTLYDGTVITLEQVNAGYTYSSNWVYFKVNNQGGEIVNLGKTRIVYTGDHNIAVRLADIMLPQDQYTAVFEIIDKSGTVVGRSIVSKNDRMTISGKEYVVDGIYAGVSLVAKAVRVKSSDKTYVLNVGQILEGNALALRLAEILPKDVADIIKKNPSMSIFEAWSKYKSPINNNRKALIEVYDYQDKSLVDVFSMDIGEVKGFGVGQKDTVKFEGCSVGFGLSDTTASFTVKEGSKLSKLLKLKIGQSFKLGGYYIRLADLSTPKDDFYATFDKIESNYIMPIQRKVGDSLFLPKGVSGVIADIGPGFTFNSKFVKIRYYDTVKILNIGDYLCPNFEITSDISNCENTNYRTPKKYMTEQMLANVVS